MQGGYVFMGRKEVLAERRALEEFYYNCKLETPEEVARLFEVYTQLIWTHHQAGLVYDYYCDETVINREGGGKMVGGVNVTEVHTIPSFAPYPSSRTVFYDIFCVGNQEDGYRFGQVTSRNGVYAKGGPSSAGVGDGTLIREEDQLNFCQCYVNKVNGRWVVTDEYLGYGEEVTRRRLARSQPFYETVLGNLEEQPEASAEEAPAVEEEEESK